MCDVRKDEQGQVLLLFIGFFSVIIILGAFVLDQGLWLARHRAIQPAADASARSGILAYLGNSSSACSSNTHARRVAAQVADASGFNVSVAACTGAAGTSFSTSTSCPSVGSSNPSVHAIVGEEQKSFLTGVFGIDPPDASADAVACAGTLERMGPADLTGYLPLWIENDDTLSGRGCFNGGVIKLGQSCVIVRACERRGGSGGNRDDCNRPSLNSGFARVPSSDECEGQSGSTNTQKSRILNEIEDNDMNWTCRINPNSSGSTCPNPNEETCFDRQTNFPENVNEHDDILDRFEERMTDTDNDCDSFGEALKRADGTSAVRPWVSGGNPNTTTYIQQCESGRLGVILLTDSTQQRVKGLAMVYILGCFDRGTAMSNVNENECTGSHNDQIEVRGAIIRAYMQDALAGGALRPLNVTSSNLNTIVITQTVE
jgi:hypothetical protein